MTRLSTNQEIIHVPNDTTRAARASTTEVTLPSIEERLKGGMVSPCGPPLFFLKGRHED